MLNSMSQVTSRADIKNILQHYSMLNTDLRVLMVVNDIYMETTLILLDRV